jgi:hypothetical protein
LHQFLFLSPILFFIPQQFPNMTKGLVRAAGSLPRCLCVCVCVCLS